MSDSLCTVEQLGQIAYDDAFALQNQRVTARQNGDIADTLLLCEHPHTYTLGTAADRSNLLLTPEQMQARGIELRQIDRGGDITYHGPGQIVGYPILDLRPDRQDVHQYVRDLEDVLIRALADLDVQAGRVAGLTGVWTRAGKIAAIGVRVSRWITSHGFALNVDTDLGYFDLIVPCGIADRGVTSLAALGCGAGREEVEARIVERFAEVFGRRLVSPGAAAAEVVR